MSKTLSDYIRMMDIYSPDVQLRIQKDNKNYKTVVGGIMAILSLMLMLSITGYFLSKFFKREEATIIESSEETNKVNITDYDQYIFMLKYTDGAEEYMPADKVAIEGVFKYYYLEDPSDPTSDLKKKSLDIKFEPCDINNEKHVKPQYKYLLENVPYIDTYLCPIFPRDHIYIEGQYGDVESNSFITYYVRRCIEERDNRKCDTVEEMENYLREGTLYVMTMTNSIRHLTERPDGPVAKGYKFPASLDYPKRMWLLLRNIEYQVDYGFIFEEKVTFKFFQVYETFSELENNYSAESTVPYNILKFTISNYKSLNSYVRTYMKAQTLLANIGGIINGISIVAYILNYAIGMRLYTIYMINHVPEIQYKANKMLNEYYKKNNCKFKINMTVLGSRKVVSDTPCKKDESSDKEKEADKKKEREKVDIQGIKSIKFINDSSQHPLENIKKNFQEDDKSIEAENKKMNNEIVAFNKLKSQVIVPTNRENNNDQSKKINIDNTKQVIMGTNGSKIFKKFDSSYISLRYLDGEKKFQLKKHQLILPICCFKNSKEGQFYRLCHNMLAEETEISNIVNKMTQLDKVKESTLNEDQLTMFNFLYQCKIKNNDDKNFLDFKHNISFETFLKIYTKVYHKEGKERIDEFLLSSIDQDMEPTKI